MKEPLLSFYLIMTLFNFLGEVVRAGTEDVNCNFMTPVSAKDQTKSLWKWPSNSDNVTIHRNSVVPIKPCLEISKFSTHRLIIFEMTNVDLVEKFF